MLTLNLILISYFITSFSILSVIYFCGKKIIKIIKNKTVMFKVSGRVIVWARAIKEIKSTWRMLVVMLAIDH